MQLTMQWSWVDKMCSKDIDPKFDLLEFDNDKNVQSVKNTLGMDLLIHLNLKAFSGIVICNIIGLL